MEIRDLDLTDLDECRSWYDTSNASNRVERPGFVPRPFDEQLAELREPTSGEERVDLVAVDADGAVLGTVMGWLPTEDNLSTAWVLADVHPDHRRRGIGRALVAAVEERLDPSRRELVGAVKYQPLVDPQGLHPYRRFCESVGYAVTQHATMRELAWPVDRAAVDALAVEPDGYRIETFIDGVPDELRESLGILKGLVDVDAPSGDIAWEPSPVTPERYAEELARHQEAGRRSVESVALDAAGTVVAFTEVIVPSQDERHLSQEGTLVLDSHRGHRLGLAVKVANLRALLDLDLRNPIIRTGNDDTNTFMVGINEQLGFVPAQTELIVTKRR